MGTVTYRKVDVDGIGVFYREAGPKDAPTILLLHGFPTAGHMFRDLIPQLADRFRLLARYFGNLSECFPYAFFCLEGVRKLLPLLSD